MYVQRVCVVSVCLYVYVCVYTVCLHCVQVPHHFLTDDKFYVTMLVSE